MCYAIPGKIVRIDNNIAFVDYFGELRRVLNEFEDVDVGDYVYAQGGIILGKVNESDALSILGGWRERFYELKSIDRKISINSINSGNNVRKEFSKILGNIGNNKTLGRGELLRLLKSTEKGELDLLFNTANGLRQKHIKNACCVHGIIEFSNYCRNNCLYCGIRKGNSELKRYRMSVNEIAMNVEIAVNKFGFKAIVLQSGEDMFYTTDMMVEMISEIKRRCGVLLFMSVGERSLDCYKRMYKAGARGSLFRFESSNKELYKKIHSGRKSNFEKRLKLLESMNKMGYIIATGSLIGIPGQGYEDILNDILLAKALNAEMYSFGPLIHNPKTPLKDANRVDKDMMFKVISVARIIEPDAKILVTAALETLDNDNGRKKGLLAGANSLMINLTPEKYKRMYYLYPNKYRENKGVKNRIKETVNLLYSLGRAPTDLGMRE